MIFNKIYLALSKMIYYNKDIDLFFLIFNKTYLVLS